MTRTQPISRDQLLLLTKLDAPKRPASPPRVDIAATLLAVYRSASMAPKPDGLGKVILRLVVCCRAAASQP